MFKRKKQRTGLFTPSEKGRRARQLKHLGVSPAPAGGGEGQGPSASRMTSDPGICSRHCDFWEGRQVAEALSSPLLLWGTVWMGAAQVPRHANCGASWARDWQMRGPSV